MEDSPPPEYVDFILMRDVYHCTPSELGEQTQEDVMITLLCLEVESTVKKAREGKKG